MKYNYYGVKGDYVWHLASDENCTTTHWFKPKLFNQSEVVWCQGPRGGVKICHIDWANDIYMQGQKRYRYGYCKPNSQAMQEFMWIKLRAQSLNAKLWSQSRPIQLNNTLIGVSVG
jgi:hypothetical protein